MIITRGFSSRLVTRGFGSTVPCEYREIINLELYIDSERTIGVEL